MEQRLRQREKELNRFVALLQGDNKENLLKPNDYARETIV